MITLPITYPWHVCTPTLFRYLPAVYVNSFFSDGSLRLSSFASFKKHEDEQRLDKTEGETGFVHRTEQGGGQTVLVNAYHGLNAYVLSASMRHDDALMKAFGCDSYIRINNPTEFGIRVSRHIPGLKGGGEGPCLYQNRKVIERDLGYIDVKQFADPTDPSKLDQEKLERFFNDQMQHYPFFLKHSSYSHQVEYRLLWITSTVIDGFLDIKVPEAIPLCSLPSSYSE